MHERVLIVEDEEAIQELLRHHLLRAGFEVRSALTGGQALTEAARWQPDAIILDLLLPDQHGLDVCRQLLAAPPSAQAPAIIMLTALQEEADRVAGLELGADDYVAKPFSPKELVARVRAVLRRRSATSLRPEGETLRIGNLVIDPVRHQVLADGTAVDLTRLEFSLLRTLAAHPGAVLSREQLIDHAWGPDFVGETRTVDVHIRHIREKLTPHGLADMVETVRGIGYRLRGDTRG